MEQQQYKMTGHDVHLLTKGFSLSDGLRSNWPDLTASGFVRGKKPELVYMVDVGHVTVGRNIKDREVAANLAKMLGGTLRPYSPTMEEIEAENAKIRADRRDGII